MTDTNEPTQFCAPSDFVSLFADLERVEVRLMSLHTPLERLSVANDAAEKASDVADRSNLPVEVQTDLARAWMDVTDTLGRLCAYGRRTIDEAVDLATRAECRVIDMRTGPNPGIADVETTCQLLNQAAYTLFEAERALGWVEDAELSGRDTQKYEEIRALKNRLRGMAAYYQ